MNTIGKIKRKLSDACNKGEFKHHGGELYDALIPLLDVIADQQKQIKALKEKIKTMPKWPKLGDN